MTEIKNNLEFKYLIFRDNDLYSTIIYDDYKSAMDNVIWLLYHDKRLKAVHIYSIVKIAIYEKTEI